MDDHTDKLMHSDPEFAGYLGKYGRRGLLGLTLTVAPLAFTWAGLFTEPRWAEALLVLGIMGMTLVVFTVLNLGVGLVGQCRRLPARLDLPVPASLEVQAYERRMNPGQDPA